MYIIISVNNVGQNGYTFEILTIKLLNASLFFRQRLESVIEQLKSKLQETRYWTSLMPVSSVQTPLFVVFFIQFWTDK